MNNLLKETAPSQQNIPQFMCPMIGQVCPSSVNNINKELKEPAPSQQNSLQFMYPMMGQTYPYMEDDEINLIDLWRTIWKWKWLIIALVLLSALCSVLYALNLPNIYRSDATVIPREQEKTVVPSALAAFGGMGGIAGDILGLGGNGSLEKFETVLNSRIITNKIYDKHRLEILPALYEEIWDPGTKTWINLEDSSPPTVQDITKSIREQLTIKNDKKTGTLSVQFDHKDPAFSKKMVDYYLIELSEFLRQATLKDSQENQRFLSDQLRRTSDVLLKEKIYALLAKEIEKETFARAQNPYSFQILDPPIISDLDKKVKPKRSMICILSVVVAGFMGIFLAFFIEYVRNARKETKQI